MEIDSEGDKNCDIFKSEYDDNYSNFNSIRMIDSKLFEPTHEYDLQKLFQPEKQLQTFQHDELDFFKQNLQKNIEFLTQNKNEIQTTLKLIQEGTIKNAFKKIILESFENHFQNFFNSVFDKIQNCDTFDNFCKQLTGKYYQNCIINFKQLLKQLAEPSKVDSLSSNFSIATKISKRVPWSEHQEKELLQLMGSKYPFQIPYDQLLEFAQKHNRTKGAVTNKIQKLKKKYSHMFTNKQEQIIYECLNGSINGQNIEQKLLSSLHQKELTFDDIMHEFKVTSYDIQSKDYLNDFLWQMISKNKIKTKEVKYVIQKDSENKETNSPIIQTILNQMQQRNQQYIRLKEVKEILIQTFPQMNPEQKNFDSDLEKFIEASKVLQIQTKKVFCQIQVQFEKLNFIKFSYLNFFCFNK